MKSQNNHMKTLRELERLKLEKEVNKLDEELQHMRAVNSRIPNDEEILAQRRFKKLQEDNMHNVKKQNNWFRRRYHLNLMIGGLQAIALLALAIRLWTF